jgi:ferredoxin
MSPGTTRRFRRTIGDEERLMKIRVIEGKCCGQARCAAVAPEFFILNDEGYLDIPERQIAPEQEALARRGARACPERAIMVIEDQ